MRIPLSPMAMYAAMKANGIPRNELNKFATYLEQLPDSESPHGTLADLDRWFEEHYQHYLRTGNILIKNQ